MSIQLNKDQQIAFDRIESDHKNFFICGKPGVGKSVLINYLTDNGRKTYTLSAPTGLAALNIGGRTIHSIFRLPTSGGVIAPDFNNFPNDSRVINNIRYNVTNLIIDEVSMVRADMFDYMDRLMRHAKGKDLPFGGAQVIVIGDLFQLPPVVVGKIEDNKLKEYGYDTPFIFSSKVFQNNFEIITLNEVMRQKGDPDFIDLLHSARTGEVMPKQMKVLNKNVGLPNDIRIKLASRNADAEAINLKELAKLPGDDVVFEATKFGEWPAYPAEEYLKVKVGAQIMVKKNGADKDPRTGKASESKVVNGTLGKVVEIKGLPTKELNCQEECEGYPNSDCQCSHAFNAPKQIVIELDNGDLVPIFIQHWERKIKEKIGDKWEERVVASYEQMPIALAWAISIHKSQGQSFDKVHIDASRIFAPGQLYVALSRCRTLAGISLESAVTTSKFFANRDVIQFFDELENKYAE